MAKRYILLDRDGTIIHDGHYLSDPEQVELLDGAARGLREMQRLGFGLIVLSNQSGVARGYFDENSIALVNDRMAELLKAEGVAIDGIYYCPHGPDDGCDCRKPKTGLVEQAQSVFGFEPGRSIFIGDKNSDIETGINIGAKTILVRTGKGLKEEATTKADFVTDNLTQAAKLIKMHCMHDDIDALACHATGIDKAFEKATKKRPLDVLSLCLL